MRVDQHRQMQELLQCDAATVGLGVGSLADHLVHHNPHELFHSPGFLRLLVYRSFITHAAVATIASVVRGNYCSGTDSIEDFGYLVALPVRDPYRGILGRGGTQSVSAAFDPIYSPIGDDAAHDRAGVAALSPSVLEVDVKGIGEDGPDVQEEEKLIFPVKLL